MLRQLTIVVFLSFAAVACRESNQSRTILMVGVRSEPDASQIIIGSLFRPEQGESLSVYGLGDYAEDTWGRINFRWGDQDVIEFTKGGVVSWAPIGESTLSAHGVADVPLVAFVVQADVTDQLEPQSMTIKQMWHIPKGDFTLNYE
jgi:hypothetical protein